MSYLPDSTTSPTSGDNLLDNDRTPMIAEVSVARRSEHKPVGLTPEDLSFPNIALTLSLIAASRSPSPKRNVHEDVAQPPLAPTRRSDPSPIEHLTLLQKRSFKPRRATYGTSVSPPQTLSQEQKCGEIMMYQAIDKKRRSTLDNTRQPAVPVQLDLHIEMMINSEPLFKIDKDEASNTIRPRRFSLTCFKYRTHANMFGFIEEQCRQMWIAAKRTVEQDCDFGAVNAALVKNEEWVTGVHLDHSTHRVTLKLEEDGEAADTAVARTVIYGDDSGFEKSERYREWYHRVVENGRLGVYTVEYTVDMLVEL